jgi:hypothetical protein
MIRSLSPAAERMRQFRERRRRGLRCVRISLHVTEIDGLIRKRYLEPNNRDDQNEIQMAIDAFINDTLGDMA